MRVGEKCVFVLAEDMFGGKLKARQTVDGLEVSLPATPCNEIAPVLRIQK